jgi:hypothetical protein
MKTLRMWMGTIVLLVGIAVLPAEAVPIAVTQELTFTEVRPWGTFTTGALTADHWSLNPFPFTDASQISSIRFWFDSTDADYAGTGHAVPDRRRPHRLRPSGPSQKQ